MVQEILITTGLALGGVLLIVLGRWGWINAFDLPPSNLDDKGRAHRTGVLLRGSLACYLFAAILLVAALLRWL